MKRKKILIFFSILLGSKEKYRRHCHLFVAKMLDDDDDHNTNTNMQNKKKKTNHHTQMVDEFKCKLYLQSTETYALYVTIYCI